jgi:hypothetical protein
LGEEQQESIPKGQPEIIYSDADSFFKYVMRELALSLGIELTETEYQHTTTRSDLTLTVKPEVDLVNTLLDFLREHNIIEFKSENDSFGIPEFSQNEARVDLHLNQIKAKDFSTILNLFIISYKPVKFLAEARKRRIIFKGTRERPWLLRAQNGFQDVVLIVLRDLPIKEPYLSLLVFAPSKSEKWKLFVESCLMDEDKDKYLKWAAALRPEAYQMVQRSVAKKTGATPNKVEKQLSTEELLVKVDRFAAFVRGKMTLEEWEEQNNKRLDEALAKLPLERRLAGLTTKQRLKGLNPEERVAGLNPEERVAGLKPEERFVGLKPEERVAGLNPEEEDALLKFLLSRRGNPPVEDN